MEDGVMMAPARIVRLVGITGLIGWLGLVGWVAKSTRAQNGGQPRQAVPPSSRDEIAGRDAAPPPALAPTAASGAASAAVTAPSPAQDNSAALSVPKLAADQAPLPVEPGSVPVAGDKPVAASEPVGTVPSIAAGDDPEQSAQSFVERNQKEAEVHLKALTAEAERLRARLTKLESGIRKWESLVSALKAAQQGKPIAATVAAPRAEEAGDLEPIKTDSAAPRSDKRVKWASAPAAAATTPGPAAETAPNQGPPATQPIAQPAPTVVPAVPAAVVPR
jgi:hypothetical protein